MNPIVLFSVLTALVVAIFGSLRDDYNWESLDFVPGSSQENLCDRFSTSRCSVYFPFEKCSIHGWFYPPLDNSSSEWSLVILFHGLGSQKDMGLDAYATYFRNQGFAALAIDYRGFGGSFCNDTSRYPRNWIYPWNHVDDIVTVVNNIHDNGLVEFPINRSSISLWGTSFGGGHVLVAASQLGNKVTSIVSQVPHLSGKAASVRGMQDRGILGSLKVAFLSISDLVFSHYLGFSPINVRIAGSKTDVAYMMMNKNDLQTYFSKHPTVYLGGWQNWAPARTLLMMSIYNPVDFVSQVAVPILFIGATEDSLCPLEITRVAHFRASKSELLEINSTHFEIYSGKPFEEAITSTISFLRR